MRGLNKDDLYVWLALIPNPRTPPITTNLAVSTPSLNLSHRRLGHPNLRTLMSVLHYFSLPFSKSSNSQYCNSCCCNKSTQLPFSNNSLISHKPLEIVYTDVWAPPLLNPLTKKDIILFLLITFLNTLGFTQLKIRVMSLPSSPTLSSL